MKRFFFIFLILLIVGVVLVAPGLMADRAANALRQSFDSMSVPGMVEVELAEVDQGWFSSKAKSRIRILPGLSESLEEEDIEFEDISLNLDHVLRHGPLMWTDEGPKLALAYLETDLDAPEDASPMLQGYLAGRPLLALRTSIGFGGGSVTNISNPPIEPNTPGYETVTWDGLNGKISYQGEDLDIDIKAPRFDTNMGAISGKMLGLKIEADLQKAGKSLWMGDSEFSIEEIDASGPLPSLPINIKGLSLGSEAEKTDDGGMDAEARYG
ncbi:MAG: DUF945 family protein, partial [Alphaproteobacteria bacterium]|nr:DUF945 family protein [Alphaproteobacteria bacterium]